MKQNLLRNALSMNKIGILFFLSFFSFLGSKAQSNAPQTPFMIDNAQLNVVTSTPINHIQAISPLVVDPNAVYSDVTNFTGNGVNNNNAANVGGVRMTSMLGDDISIAGTPPYTIVTLRFSAGNLNAVAVSAAAKVRFYYADGTGGNPGTFIGGINFTAFTFNATSVYTFTYNIPSPFLTLTSSNIWAGLEFDNTGASPNPTIAQLKMMGPGIYDPVDIGSSQDLIFETTNPGDFAASNPVGTQYAAPFAGAPVGNFGWEFVNDVPLPINIEYLHGSRNGLNHNLSWKVDAITIPVTMSLERSTDKHNFSSIYTAAASSANTGSIFSYIDSHPSAGINYYRLKITDADGKAKYSNIIALLNQQSGFQIVSIQPNPVVGATASLNITSAQSGQVHIDIFDISGRKVLTQTVQVIAGSTQVNLNVSNLAKGSYEVRGYNNDGNSQTIKLLKN